MFMFFPVYLSLLHYGIVILTTLHITYNIKVYEFVGNADSKTRKYT